MKYFVIIVFELIIWNRSCVTSLSIANLWTNICFYNFLCKLNVSFIFVKSIRCCKRWWKLADPKSSASFKHRPQNQELILAQTYRLTLRCNTSVVHVSVNTFLFHLHVKSYEIIVIFFIIRLFSLVTISVNSSSP